MEDKKQEPKRIRIWKPKEQEQLQDCANTGGNFKGIKRI